MHWINHQSLWLQFTRNFVSFALEPKISQLATNGLGPHVRFNILKTAHCLWNGWQSLVKAFVHIWLKQHGMAISGKRYERPMCRWWPECHQNVLACQLTFFWRVSEAEKLPVEDNSVDLITVGMALHWFDHPKFYKEVCNLLYFIICTQ